MKLGVMIEVQEGIGWPEWQRIVRATEDFGFESLWRSDHFFSFGADRTKPCIETFTALTYAATATTRIKFGTLVASMTFRPPAMVARMAAGIDSLSGGRLILGIGGGWNQAEHDAFGIELPEPKRRLDMLEEGAIVIKSLVGHDDASFDGKYYQLQNAYVNPKPAQTPLPILIGGSGEKRLLQIVARHANEWNMPVQPVEVYRQKIAALEAHCEKEKRDPATIERSLMVAYITGATEAEVAQRRDRAIANASPRLKERLDAGEPLPWLVGTPAQLVEQVQAWEAEGVSRLQLQHLAEPDYEQLELVAKEVLPKV
ncbi:MAG: TIGR03560 family F420-dependent LLM class oxidoreductase [Dehalococcoidia bacterium]